MRPFIVAANWKMNMSPTSVREYFDEFLPKVAESRKPLTIFFPPALLASHVANCLEKNAVVWGGQNCYPQNSGAFTGENSPQVLSDLGASYVLVGHSERRTLFHEDDAFLAEKIQAAQKNGLQPVLCVGETLEQRQAGGTEKVIRSQLRQGLSKVDWSRDFIVAYEPVWAIGTGEVATAEQANQSHMALRKTLIELSDKDKADSTPIIYGGSVKPNNAQALAEMSDIDGFLVGGASLEPEGFAVIANTTA